MQGHGAWLAEWLRTELTTPFIVATSVCHLALQPINSKKDPGIADLSLQAGELNSLSLSHRNPSYFSVFNPLLIPEAFYQVICCQTVAPLAAAKQTGICSLGLYPTLDLSQMSFPQRLSFSWCIRVLNDYMKLNGNWHAWEKMVLSNAETLHPSITASFSVSLLVFHKFQAAWYKCDHQRVFVH